MTTHQSAETIRTKPLASIRLHADPSRMPDVYWYDIVVDGERVHYETGFSTETDALHAGDRWCWENGYGVE